MRPEQVQLLLRKQRLQWRIAEQRSACVSLLREVEGAAAIVERARSLGARLRGLCRAHAAELAVLGATLLVWRPRRALRWLRRAWWLWRVVRLQQGRLGALLQLLSRLAGS